MPPLIQTSVLNIRLDPDERALREAAAEQTHTAVGDFGQRKAIEASETEMLNRSSVTITADDWEQIEAWVRRPAVSTPLSQSLGT